VRGPRLETSVRGTVRFPGAVPAVLLFLTAGCVSTTPPTFNNPFDPSAPPIALTLKTGNGVTVSWDVRPFVQAPILSGATIALYRHISLPLCNPDGGVPESCGNAVLVATTSPLAQPNPEFKDATLSIPWGPRQITYSLQLIEASGQAYTLALLDSQEVDGADIDGDSVTVGDCDDANPAVGACDPNATCAAKKGVWSCTCNANYVGDGATCEQDCAVNHGGCDLRAVCSNMSGVPHCACTEGFVGDGTTCACPPGYAICFGATCSDTASDVDNCGGCGLACAPAHASGVCASGVCAIGQCTSGFADCDNDAVNGCESNLSQDPGNCSACGNACNPPNAVPLCVDGACGMGACHSGFGNCNNDPSDGCETNLETSANNCSQCGQVCSLTNAVAACSAGSCVVASCDGTFDDCDGEASTGCETNLANDAMNCGSCGHQCSLDGGAGVCSDGLCGVGP